MMLIAVWILLFIVMAILLSLVITTIMDNYFTKIIEYTPETGFWVALRYQIFGRSKNRSGKSGKWSAQIYTPDQVRKILGAAGHDNESGVQ